MWNDNVMKLMELGYAVPIILWNSDNKVYEVIFKGTTWQADTLEDAQIKSDDICFDELRVLDHYYDR